MAGRVYSIAVPRIISVLALLTLALQAAVFLSCATKPDPRVEALKIEAGAHRLATEGRHQEAIAEYSRAIQVAPDLPILYHERGVSYTWTGDLAAAIADFDTALRLDPQRPSTLYERGAAYYRLADFAKAEEDLQAAVDMTSDPDVVIPAMRLLDSIRSGDAALSSAGQ